MRRGGGVDGKRAGVADIGDVVEKLEGVDELPTGLLSARDLEADQLAMPAPKIFLRPPARFALLVRRVDDFRYFRALPEPRRDRRGVRRVALHAQRQSLDPLQRQERVEWRHR